MKQYVAAIDQSTSASKAYLVDAKGEIIREKSLVHRQMYPQPGHVEHDAEQIYRNVVQALASVLEGIPAAQVAALAISNQRETTVLFDAATGAPLCPAIVWQDIRGQALCDRLAEHGGVLREKTGLPLGPYFSAAKAASALEQYPAAREALQAGRLRIGTVDAYLVYRLTGGNVFATDVSNAARTQLLNLQTLAWDDALLDIFGIDRMCLPEIRPSDALFGETCAEGIPSGIPICGVMGDSHAALFAHGCHTRGEAKATFGTGSSVMMNTGDVPVFSAHGLQTTVGFQFRGKVCYAMEGNVLSSASTLTWLQNGLGLVRDIDELNALAASVPDTQGVFLVPALAGLGSPHNDAQARALLCGMSHSTTRAHVARAALESLVYQDMDVLEAMARDMGMEEQGLALRVDGGAAKNNLLLQLLSDMIRCPVTRARSGNLSALGVAYMGGIATGLYGGFDTLVGGLGGDTFAPQMSETERDARRSGWQAAVRRTQYQP